MTLTQISLTVGATVVVAVWCVRMAFVSSSRSVSATYRRLYTPRPATASTAATSPWSRLVASLADSFASSASGERLEQRRRYAMRTAGFGVAALAARAVTVAAMLWVIATVALLLLSAADTVAVWMVVAVPPMVAVVGGWYQASAIVAVAERRYRQFRAEAGAYVSLVAVCMTTQRTAAESVAYAAEVGTGHAFETIHAAVRAAPQMGIRVWDAIEAVGVEYGCRELEDLAASVAHVSGIGVGVDATVTAIATRMRQIALDDMQITADKQTSAMFGPTMLFVGGVVAFLAYPLATRILDALSTQPT
jgi:hypothetical protein